MKPKYVVTETLTLYLVPDLLLKRSVKPHAILLDKVDHVIFTKSSCCRSRYLEVVRRSVLGWVWLREWKKMRII